MVRVFDEPGRFRAAFQVPKWHEGGEWKLLGLTLADKTNNEINLFPANVSMLRSVTVHVDGDPAVTDLEAPVLLALQFLHDEPHRDAGMQITALVEDDRVRREGGLRLVLLALRRRLQLREANQRRAEPEPAVAGEASRRVSRRTEAEANAGTGTLDHRPHERRGPPPTTSASFQGINRIIARLTPRARGQIVWLKSQSMKVIHGRL
jgi:hypothetical protein